MVQGCRGDDHRGEGMRQIIKKGHYKIEACCDDFAEAFQSGTDNEGYGSLMDGYDGIITAGSIERRIKFCPWCGRPTSELKYESLVKE